jgi:hypothetical protein
MLSPRRFSSLALLAKPFKLWEWPSRDGLFREIYQGAKRENEKRA